MPPLNRLVRLVGRGTFPATRGVVVAVARSGNIRGIAHRAVHDPVALVRGLGNARKAKAMVRATALHPATRELADAGLVFLPGRFLPIGWVTTWAMRQVLRRYLEPPPPAEVTGGLGGAAIGPPKVVAAGGAAPEATAPDVTLREPTERHDP